jgi:hypothetical protein
MCSVTGGRNGVPPPTTTGLRNIRSSSTRPSSTAAAAKPAPPIETSLSVLIAGAALSNSVFAALAIDSVTGLGGWEIAALVVLGIVLACGLTILLPHRLVFVLDVDELYANLWADRDDLPLVYRRLADVLWRSRRRNFKRVRALHAVLAAGIVLLGVDLAFWGIALAV